MFNFTQKMGSFTPLEVTIGGNLAMETLHSFQTQSLSNVSIYIRTQFQFFPTEVQLST